MPQYKVGDKVSVVQIMSDEDTIRFPKSDSWRRFIGHVGTVRDLVPATSVSRASTYLYDVWFDDMEDWAYFFTSELRASHLKPKKGGS